MDAAGVAAMRLMIMCGLNAHFVEAAAAKETFDHQGVQVMVAITREGDARFASITCSGSVELRQPEPGPPQGRGGSLRAGDVRMIPGLFFLVPPAIDPRWDAQLMDAHGRIEGVLEQVGALVRWRFGLSGRDAIFKDVRAMVTTDAGAALELQPIGQAAMGDDSAAIETGGLSEVARLVGAGITEPLAHQLWREAWNLRFANPRSSLVIGVMAAEVGLKQLIATLVPPVRWVIVELPSPPLGRMMKHALADLEIRADVDRERRSPRHLRQILDAAVAARNDVVHQGTTPQVELRRTLLAVREFLYLLDFYGGSAWALANLSDQTVAALGIKR